MIKMGVIAPLPGGVVSHLRSSTILSDFEQAVEELVCNSLDAGATEVHLFPYSPTSTHTLVPTVLLVVNFSCKIKFLIKTVD